MAGEAPKVGQIVDHHFLWLEERNAGQIEGRKARPCLIIAVEPREHGEPRVTVLPITSQPPRPSANVVAIPDEVKSRIGLSHGRSAWIVIDEANTFTWPGFDLVPQPHGGFVRGMITRGLFERVRTALLARAQGRRRAVDRD
jgi:PemK-like, MazF-like toxin of type II toxin-antitoxin system